MNLHVVKWSLTAVAIGAGMVGAGYLLAAIVMDRIINGSR